MSHMAAISKRSSSWVRYGRCMTCAMRPHPTTPTRTLSAIRCSLFLESDSHSVWNVPAPYRRARGPVNRRAAEMAAPDAGSVLAEEALLPGRREEPGRDGLLACVELDGVRAVGVQVA